MPAESAVVAETPAALPHFIIRDGGYLFAWHHPGRPLVRRGAAVILCPPLGSDYICAYRAWRRLAERLASMGFDVLRFDYEGTGDSSGALEEPCRVRAWLDNIEQVITEARKLTGSSEVALVGLRIGAVLALHAAAARGGVDRLVLWSAFRSGRAYVRELKALSRLSQKDYADEKGEGPDILAAGYVLPGAIARSLEGLDFEALSIAPARRVLLVDRDDRCKDATMEQRLERLGSYVTRISPPGSAQMLEQAPFAKVPDAALDSITGWLGEWRSGSTPNSCADKTGAGSELAHGSGYHEIGVRFGPSDRLYGILSVPDATSTAPAIIFLNTNFEYRVGPHRLYVPLARELAEKGHVVLRYDLGGIGDSEPPAGATENVAYPAHAIDDAREAIAFIRKRAPGRQLIVAGLCSGGWHVFGAARAGLPVDAIVSVNPPLYLRDGASSTRLRDPARWERALRHPLGVHLMHSIRRHLTRRWVHNQENGSYRRLLGQMGKRWIGTLVGSRLFDGLARDLDSISARGITSFFVFSRGDKGFEYFELYASAWLRRRKARDYIRHQVVDDAGHTFSPPQAQRRLRELVIDFVIQQTFRDRARA